jgi:hypothetical protein
LRFTQFVLSQGGLGHGVAAFKTEVLADIDALRAKVVAFDIATLPTVPAVSAVPVKAAPAVRRFTGITTTSFSGPNDENDSAYAPYRRIDPSIPGASLPARFAGTRPQLKAISGDKSVDCAIVDVGPWNIRDAYWTTTAGRPLAEQQYRDRTPAQNGHVPSNDAGLDLTPGAWKALGFAGNGNDKAVLDWEFVVQPSATGVSSMSSTAVPTSTVAPVGNATSSKINLTQVGAMAAQGAALWIGQKFNLDATTQGAVQVIVQGVFSTATVIMRTWFTTKILKQSVSP